MGTGLGLALVRDHVRAHGGACWYEDAPSGGARFVVEIPRSDEVNQ
jgi:signal transduction histidine kinase